MEPIPLIPKSTVKSNHDTSHVIRESFQELLGKSIYPENIMENMSKFVVDMEELKTNAVFAEYSHHKHKANTGCITDVEKEMMEHHGIYLISKEVLSEDKMLAECLKLKRYSLLPDVRKLHANKYGLIKQDSLLPSAPEKAIDFRLQTNVHYCAQNCISDKSLRVPSVKTKNAVTQVRRQKVHKQRIFEASPGEIIFHNYELNVTYKKVLKVRNLTKTIRSLALKDLPKTKYFIITLESSCRIAPGMCAVYSVQYLTDIYRDVKETIRFTTYTGRDVIVKLRSCSYSPSLRVYVFKTGILFPDQTKNENVAKSEFNIERTMALNASIDCGHTLIGREVKLSLIMKNDGGHGKFFFMNEADWYHYSVLNINENMILLAGTFQLHPVYFEVNENEFVEVVISFLPKRHGLFVETVYLLCSNNTCEELDLIGDGVYFQKSFITFDLKPKDCNPFFLDFESEYCMHVGKTLCCQVTTAVIKVENKSPLNLDYHWAIRKSENSMNPDFKHLAPQWITIDEKSKYLPRYNVKEFAISINPATTVEGLYRIVLCLYIENIPEISLRDYQDFTVIERKDSTQECKNLDILVGEVELLLDVDAIGVIIEPNPLIVPFHPQTSAKYSESITIIPQTTYKLRCQWKHHKTNKGTVIEPRTFELNTKQVKCTVTVENTDVGNMKERFLLWVNDGVLKQHFQVILSTELPRVSFNPAALIFDDLMNQFLYEKTTYIENPSHENVSWHIIEEIIDPERGNVAVEDSGTRIIPNNGFLKPGEKCKIRYIANTTMMGEKISFLKIFTNFTDRDKFDAICNIRYKVCKPELLVHTNTSDLPLLCPDDLLFVGIETKMHICIHNTGNIVAIFLWGSPTGTSANDFEIMIAPKIGIIKRQESVHVDVTIKPKSMGYFEDVYIPLFALGIDKVILVKLMCLVGDITVNIYIPDINDEYELILWPKIIPDEYEEKYAPEFSPPLIGSVEEQDSNLEYSYEDTSKYFGGTTYTTMTTYEDPIEISNVDEEETASNVTSSMKKHLSISFSESKVSSSRGHTPTTSYTESPTSTPKRSIKGIISELFKENVIIQKYSIEFQNVPLKTPVKKTVKIENLTPGSGLVHAESVNFYQEVERKNVINTVLAKLKMTKSTEWDDIVTSDGIVVKIEEPNKQLHSFEIIEFNVWVYATTWGYYVDELVIDISQMLPFCASILIEVVGHPIEYPIAQNSIRTEPIVRLGVLSYKAENVKRRVKVVNTSVCTIYVTWQIFFDIEENETKSFSVLLDMPISDQEFKECDSQPRFILTNEYYGQVNTNYFEIHPPTSKILPGEFVYVEITTNVSNFDEYFLNQSIFAYLVGIIKVPCGCRIQPYLYVRPHGIDIGCTKVRITLEIDLPTLIVDDLPDKIKLTTFASDIMDRQVFQTSRRVLLKNSSLTQALVYLEIEKPFKIASITVPHMKLKELKGSVIVNPEDTMEIVIECVMTKEDVMEMVDNMKVRSNVMSSSISTIDFVQSSLKISKQLSVYQRGFLQKMIPLELKVFFPVFKAKPVHIQFGNVYIGNTAKQIVSLRSMTASLNFEVYKTNKYSEIIVTPQKGIIPKFNSGEECILSIFFTPTEPQTYLLWFAVETALPHHFVVVNVVGVGTYDENFYRPGLH